MAIHWYPGHMYKANKDMAEILPQVDVVIELLDARLPFSSANPSIAKFSENKPCIKIFSKADLADDATTELWRIHYEQQGAKTLSLGIDKSQSRHKVMQQIRALVPHKGEAGKTIMAMIAGIPNVGKSTLINALAQRNIAKTGNEPAITKMQQRIKLEEHIALLDTPGILWPKIPNENSGYRLAATGAIKSTAMSSDDVAFYVVEYMLKHYPESLKNRYGFDTLPETELEFLEMLGHQRGCLRSRGRVDLDKVSNIVINELRDGSLGKISFETPLMIAHEEAIVARKLALKAETDAARKKNFKNKR